MDIKVAYNAILNKIRKFDSSQIKFGLTTFFNSSRNDNFTLLIKRITKNYRLISNLFLNVYSIKNILYAFFRMHFEIRIFFSVI